jgi:hypothetical protein
MGAVLTAVFYLFRWGHRRGKGKFADKFSANGDRPTAASVSNKLIADNNSFRGWQSEPARAILGDLLLAHVFDTKGRAGGRETTLQRIFPTHYLASWIDLPETFANLRGVPEAIVSLLANKPKGNQVESGQWDARFPVGRGIKGNILLELFAPRSIDR